MLKATPCLLRGIFVSFLIGIKSQCFYIFTLINLGPVEMDAEQWCFRSRLSVPIRASRMSEQYLSRKGENVSDSYRLRYVKNLLQNVEVPWKRGRRKKKRVDDSWSQTLGLLITCLISIMLWASGKRTVSHPLKMSNAFIIISVYLLKRSLIQFGTSCPGLLAQKLSVVDFLCLWLNCR